MNPIRFYFAERKRVKQKYGTKEAALAVLEEDMHRIGWAPNFMYETWGWIAAMDRLRLQYWCMTTHEGDGSA